MLPQCGASLLKEKDRPSLEQFLAWTKQMEYQAMSAPHTAKRATLAEDSLFLSITSNPLHVVRDLLPAATNVKYDFRLRAHKAA